MGKSAIMKVVGQHKRWAITEARRLYSIDAWSGGYYDINEKGHVVALPLRDRGTQVDLIDVIEEAKLRGLQPPLLIRFQDMVRDRVAALYEAFDNAIKECDYKGKYRAVFPIKVNQLREVVEEILDAGRPYNIGLEVGSKPEIFAAQALLNKPGSLIICNGRKDRTFIRMALMGLKLGKEVILVVEDLEELEEILNIASEMNVRPLLGLRMKLLSKGSGLWASSSGEDAKFGLSTVEMLAATKLLEKYEMKDTLQLLHFHIGSQITDILLIKKAVQEGARFYCKFRKMGFPIRYLDVGGGLAVDYIGSRTTHDSSTNYTLQEYANDVVYYIANVCNGENVPHPDIISESGRAIVSYHSVLVIEVLAAISKKPPAAGLLKFEETDHPLVKELHEILYHLPQLNKLEAYHDALERRDDAQQMFAFGVLSLEEKAKVEHLYWQIASAVLEYYKNEKYVPDEIQALRRSLCAQYICNFSVFQSLLDHWALNQIFPVMPLMRLNERPTVEATLVDITCDSDGKLKHFVSNGFVKDTLLLHSLRANNDKNKVPYYLGVFLLGAYQDVIGDLHNLYGRVNEVHVFLDPDEPVGYYIEEAIEGTSIGQALLTVQYDETELKRRMKSQVDAAIRIDRLKPSEGIRLLKEYEQGLKEYTYVIRNGR